jgi:hypothetical protein
MGTHIPLVDTQSTPRYTLTLTLLVHNESHQHTSRSQSPLCNMHPVYTHTHTYTYVHTHKYKRTNTSPSHKHASLPKHTLASSCTPTDTHRSTHSQHSHPSTCSHICTQIHTCSHANSPSCRHTCTQTHKHSPLYTRGKHITRHGHTPQLTSVHTCHSHTQIHTDTQNTFHTCFSNSHPHIHKCTLPPSCACKHSPIDTTHTPRDTQILPSAISVIQQGGTHTNL